MKKNRTLAVIAMLLCMVVGLCGCQEKHADYDVMTLELDTGDTVKVFLNIADGYYMWEEDSRIYVGLGDITLLSFAFTYWDVYRDTFQMHIDSDAECEITSKQTKDNQPYTRIDYKFKNNISYASSFFMWLEGSNTGVVAVSEDTLPALAQEAFDNLIIMIA